MHFEFYHSGLDAVPKLSVDGTVGNSVHFSHWEGNETPSQLKADTSTEIALNLVASPDRDKLTRGIELVTNNHFDTDGVLSVWTVLTGERALQLREQLIPAAEAGDFSESTNETAVRASIAIQGSDQPTPGEESGSPLACQLAGENVDDARAYELVLPEVERLLTKTDEYESLWRSAWEKIAKAMESFERGTSSVTEFVDARLSLVSLAPDVFSPSGFNPTRHAAPYTAISRYAKGELFLITTPVKNGWVYRIDYPYYSWAETIVRPRIPRRDFSGLLFELNQIDPEDEGVWKKDNNEMTSAIKFLGSDGTLAASMLTPDEVAKTIRAHSLTVQPAVAGS
ncbi:MAG TPA: DUF6687 family protein [Pyrinomonadaceae bacterium]|jgi:hypothetical protein|nr:DUF6687 family protein [Pyrinomonadaceae bacterium]